MSAKREVGIIYMRDFVKTHWELKNRVITNTGKYNKKAGRVIKKEKKEKPQEDHCIQQLTYSLWVWSTVIHHSFARLA